MHRPLLVAFLALVTTGSLLLHAAGSTEPDTLTAAEKKAGWKLLFDGKSFSGWHNFKKEGVRPGWQIKDGTLACVDPRNAGDPQRCGWLYALYQPPTDPKTGKPLDATKPAGQWNHVRLLIGAAKCEHEINGAKYFDYVLGSDDFNVRVAKSKFAKMAQFAKTGQGHLALQGDHGQVSFRNIKVREIRAKR